ncbi:peroxisomal sarcosine oxidase-like [Corticium candelabrum]|uniref:peroxisomal sarcosine oxidase-like n=1 Tax=Corticium candelabrum TaxID=121492 RepID=UPI002E260B93|nr:peroxisomal sarcosine oxidase-like [Corticium candelabrum]
MEPFDVIVVGAGIQGCSTAYQLAIRGQRTLLLEQFDALHTRGSSHGASRITRMAYDRHHYAEMMKEAFPMWDEIEKEYGQQIFVRTGFLFVDVPGGDGQTTVERVLKRVNIPMETLDDEEFRRRYPMLRYSKSVKGTLERFGGILLADKARQCLQELFLKHGGTVKTNERVLHVQPGAIITVHTSKATYKARSVVLTVGAWASELVKSLGIELPLQLKRISVCYWRVDRPEDWDADHFPAYVDFSGKHHMYGVPVYEYPGLYKLCWHHGPTLTSPNERDQVDDSAAVHTVSQYIREHMAGMSDTPSIIEPCIYTCTPDNDFILDKHPNHSNIVIGAGFSGHGFKLAPVVGRILAALAIGEDTQYDMKPFKITRFGKTVTSSL